VEEKLESLILTQLSRVEEKVDKVRSEDIPSIRERLKSVEVKSAISGAITGSIGGMLVVLATLLMKFLS
jgi:hypothetical protein